MAGDTKIAFWEDHVDGFGAITDKDDFLHPELSAAEPGFALTETQYLGFSIPEHKIHAIGYMWYHPNLKTVMGGIAVWQGFKPHRLQSEIWDYVSYMDDGRFAGDLHHYELSNGYSASVIEPLRRHRIRYHDKRTDNMVDVAFEALTPPVMLGTGMHFEQPMRTSGIIRLSGTEYEVKGTTVRDRSFGQLRHEYLVPLPPLAWMNAAFSESFAFGCTAFDDPQTGPEWSEEMRLPGDNPLRGGWIYKDGQLAELAAASKKTKRKAGSLFAEQVELRMTDKLGRVFDVKGEALAGVNWPTWHNMDSNINLMRWECGDLVTHGDYQEFLWPEYIRRFHLADAPGLQAAPRESDAK